MVNTRICPFCGIYVILLASFTLVYKLRIGFHINLILFSKSGRTNFPNVSVFFLQKKTASRLAVPGISAK